jgi:hypothetical protein
MNEDDIVTPAELRTVAKGFYRRGWTPEYLASINGNVEFGRGPLTTINDDIHREILDAMELLRLRGIYRIVVGRTRYPNEAQEMLDHAQFFYTQNPERNPCK